MSTLAAIRTAAKDTIVAAVSGLTVYDKIPASVNLPAVVITPADMDYIGAMGRGLNTHTLDLYVLVSRRDDHLAQVDLDGLIASSGSSSIPQAIWNAKTLGLSDCNAHIRSMRGYGGSFNVSDIDHVGAILTLVVHTNGAS